MNMNSLRDWELPMEQIMPLIRERLEEGGQVRLSPRGISMLPMLRQGRDSVILSPVERPLKKYDIILYQRKSGEYVLHRIVGVGETLTCMGDLQMEKERGIAREQVIAVVSAFFRGEEEWSVNHWKYRLYCRFRYHSRPLRRIKRALKAK